MPGALAGTFTKDLYFEALPYMVLSVVPITGGHRQTCRCAYYPDTGPDRWPFLSFHLFFQVISSGRKEARGLGASAAHFKKDFVTFKLGLFSECREGLQLGQQAATT